MSSQSENNMRKEYLISLYLEQIKYLRQENVSIQNSFLAGISIPVVALGVLIFYIENSKMKSVRSLYLILPFLYFSIPYNVVKYTTRMMAINGYIKKLERKINVLMSDKIFLWNSELINSGFFRGGFAVITTVAQLPIHIIAAIYLLFQFVNTLKVDTLFKPYHLMLFILLGVELIGMICMLVDAAVVQKIVMKKVESLTRID